MGNSPATLITRVKCATASSRAFGEGPESAGGSYRLESRPVSEQVFQLIGQVKGTRQLAEKLHLSAKTVEVHRVNIKARLKLESASELIRFAVTSSESQNAGA